MRLKKYLPDFISKIKEFQELDATLSQEFDIIHEHLKTLQDNQFIASEGVEVTIEQIDRKFNSGKPIIRTEKGEINLEENLVDTVHVCRDIMKDIENKLGKTVLHDKVFVGGGVRSF